MEVCVQMIGEQKFKASAKFCEGVGDKMYKDMAGGKLDSIGLPLFKKLRDRGVPVGAQIAAMMHGETGSPSDAHGRVKRFDINVSRGGSRCSSPQEREDAMAPTLNNSSGVAASTLKRAGSRGGPLPCAGRPLSSRAASSSNHYFRL